LAKVARPARTSHISRRRENARAEGGAEYASKRQELVTIAATLFKENGFKSTTLADVGERAGLDRATLYYYVGSKQELFQACIEGSLDDNLTRAEALLKDRAMGAREKIKTLVSVMMTSYDKNYPQMYVYIQEQMHEVGNDPSKWAREIQKKTRRFEAIVREMIDEGIGAGTIRADLDARIVANALFGMLNWTHRWYKPGSAQSADAIAETFGKIFFDGMSKRR
jgi:AcrR family transcriptional regulator